ncbi:MAG TPA: metal-dependent hydrolase [Anaeromyxobacteraceae bacterium]|jgi:L-ascorbate metabolism protein UlaG (beta-lactamase superfamily)
MKRLALLALSTALPLAAGAQGKTEITWYGHSAFVVTTPRGTVLAIDPWLSNPSAKDKEAAAKLAKVDYVLVTHGHSDHVGDAVALGTRTGAKLVGAFDLSRALVAAGYPKDQATAATAGNIGGTIPLGDEVSVTIVPASHGSVVSKEDGSLLAAGSPTGFVVHIKSGPTLYHTGDTDVTSDMRLVGDRHKVDLMLACIGGHFTMDPAGAATAVGLTRARAVVPMHYGTFPLLKGTPADLEKALKSKGIKARVVTFQVGETKSF